MHTSCIPNQKSLRHNQTPYYNIYYKSKRTEIEFKTHSSITKLFTQTQNHSSTRKNNNYKFKPRIIKSKFLTLKLRKTLSLTQLINYSKQHSDQIQH